MTKKNTIKKDIYKFIAGSKDEQIGLSLISSYIGYSRETVRKYLQELVDEGKVEWIKGQTIKEAKRRVARSIIRLIK